MPDRIRSDQNPNLYPGQELASANGRAVLKVHDNGDVVVWAHLSGNPEPNWERMPIWSTHTDNQPGTHFCMNNNGEVCVFKNGSDQTTWKSGSWNSGRPGPYTLVMQNDGNLVAYASDGSAIWDSGSRVSPEPVEFSHVTFNNEAHGVICWPQIRNWNGSQILFGGGKSTFWVLADSTDKTINFDKDTLDDNKSTFGQLMGANGIVSLGIGVYWGNDDWVDPLRVQQFKYVPGCKRKVTIRKYGGLRNGGAAYDGVQDV